MVDMATIEGLCKRRGFIYRSSEIYGGFNGFFDFGPLGVELKNNIKRAWWNDFVHGRDDIVGLDASIIMHPDVWRASGHVAGFSDPMVDCKESKLRFRADQIFFAQVKVDGETIGYISVLEDENMQEQADKKAAELKRKMAKQGELEPVVLKNYMDAKPDEYDLIPSPATGKAGTLTPPRDFNLMFQTYVGALRDETAIAYLRPETAQGIFADFKNVCDTTRVKVPFGIAQIGKAFRNEITPRNFIFRVREFEQAELEYFVMPGDDEKWHEYWKEERLKWWEEQGLKRENINIYTTPKEDLAHYAKACYDIEYRFPHGMEELEGIANRTDYDLGNHTKGQEEFNLSSKVHPNPESTQKLAIYEEDEKKWIVPFVIEPSMGVDRAVLALLTEAYEEEDLGNGNSRIVLKLKKHLAPIKVAVIPLKKNNEQIMNKCHEIKKNLLKLGIGRVALENTGNIGKAYRRHDEVGTPLCITVDFETIEQQPESVTIRDRDTMEQHRVNVADLPNYLREYFAR